MKTPLLLSLASLALAVSPSFAGPPERPSGRMTFDPVAAALRKFRAEKDDGKRVEWLMKLVPTRDPRVAVLALDYPVEDLSPSQYIGLRRLLNQCFVPPGQAPAVWWRDNEPRLRRRAKEMGQ